MSGVIIIMSLVGITALITFLSLYRYYWHPKKHWEELYSMLRKRGIGERPENIVKSYYKLQQKNLSEREIRKLTKEFLYNDKDFFLTMYDTTKRERKKAKNGSTGGSNVH